MADMTQPEMPERADVPDSEPQSSQDVVEPTHIGVARHREAREGFTPPPLQTPDTGPSAPTGPADRSAVEALRREAKRLADEAEEDTSSEFLGEPDMPRQESGFPLGRTIAGGLGALAVTAAGFLGFNKIHSGDDGSERPGVIITDPTLEPATPPPTFTPEPTPTPEATPTPEVVRTLEEQLGYKLYPESVIEYEGKYINMHLGVDQDVVDNTECDDPPFGKVSCLPIEKFYLSSDYVKEKGGIEMSNEELITSLEDSILTGHLVNLRKNEKYADWTLDDLKERIARIENGEDLEVPTYKVYGGYNGPAIGMPPGIEVDITKDVYIHKVHKQGIVKLNKDAAYGYKRLDDGSYVLEIWETGGLNARNTDVARFIAVPFHIANGLALAKYGYLHDGVHHSPGLGPYAQEIGADIFETAKPMLPIYDAENGNLAGTFKVDVK